jgi:hypothetical protein
VRLGKCIILRGIQIDTQVLLRSTIIDCVKSQCGHFGNSKYAGDACIEILGKDKKSVTLKKLKSYVELSQIDTPGYNCTTTTTGRQTSKKV